VLAAVVVISGFLMAGPASGAGIETLLMPGKVVAAHAKVEQDCAQCHDWTPDYCAACHQKRPASHAGNWKKNHKVAAKARGEKGCLVCHDQAFCKECH